MPLDFLLLIMRNNTQPLKADLKQRKPPRLIAMLGLHQSSIQDRKTNPLSLGLRLYLSLQNPGRTRHKSKGKPRKLSAAMMKPARSRGILGRGLIGGRPNADLHAAAAESPLSDNSGQSRILGWDGLSANDLKADSSSLLIAIDLAKTHNTLAANNQTQKQRVRS